MNEYENKFKSGDEVRVKSSSAVPIRGGSTVGIIDGGAGTLGGRAHYFVDFQNGNGNWFPEDDLELVPHPDTARLDWLEKQRAAAGVWASSKVSITVDGVQVETPTLRQAIDAAMKLSE